jgi:putative flippase GtrA
MTVILSNPRERSRFLRFAVVGAIGAVVDFGMMNLLTRLVGMRLVWAGTISFICAILSNFTFNRFWTYPDSRSKHLARQLVEFSLISVMGLAIRIPILAFLEPPLESLMSSLNIQLLPFMDSTAIADNFTLAIAVVIVMFWNFFANRYWTYSDVDN